jgi:type VI secretion system protein ImpF
MADLALNDRLQPALLDRLLDDERTIVVVKLVIDSAALEQLRLPILALLDILRGQGLSLQQQVAQANMIELRFSASQAHVSPAHLRALLLRPPGAPQGIMLQSFATVESSSAVNAEVESAERRMLSARKLRECVHRDLGWLFNSLNLESAQDLDAYPQVVSSVLNYGLPSFAGRMTSSIDSNLAAEGLRRAIEQFEPRLRAVRVRPRERVEGEDDGTLEFTIDAELWGQPVSQHLELRTKIDVMTGDISVTEARGG